MIEGDKREGEDIKSDWVSEMEAWDGGLPISTPFQV